MKRSFFIALLTCLALFCGQTTAGRRSSNYRCSRNGFMSLGFAVGAPLGGVYYADGPQGSFPYYGTPVNYGGFYAPYGYAAYAGPVVTWGW